MRLSRGSVARIQEAFAEVALGDPRRERRMGIAVDRLARKPGASLPQAMKSEAELEGTYRFVNNRAVDPQELFGAFAKTTVGRARRAGSVLVVHDTTTCSFVHADPQEVGYLPTGKAGFFAHISLVLEANEWRRPLGVVHLETISRKQRSKRSRRNKASGAETAAWKDREALRWERGSEAAATALSECASVCHIADREGDSYAFLASIAATGNEFVVRVNHNRKVGDPDDLARQWMPVKKRVEDLEGVFEREVPLSRRKAKSTPRTNKAHPPRKARMAQLRFTATTVVLRRPRYVNEAVADTLTLNVVHVVEPNPPKEQSPVEWLLFTTLPIDSETAIATVVDNYRTRWTIEEFNKVLKTGCAYERREFESQHALLTLLAISLPIACELLWLRSRARTDPNAPATDVLTKQQLQVLRLMGARPLPPKPTVQDALWVVAGIGGHQKRNGDPGWLVLYRGMQELLAYEAGYEAGLKAGTRP